MTKRQLASTQINDEQFLSLSLASLRNVEEGENMNLSDTCCTLFSLSWKILLMSTRLQSLLFFPLWGIPLPSLCGHSPYPSGFSPFLMSPPAPYNAAQCGLSYQVLPFIISSLQLVFLLLIVGKFDSVAFFIAFFF